MNVPRLRFIDVNGREFPEWEKKIIEELVNSKIILKPLDGNHGELHPKSSDYVDMGIPFIMANDIRNNVVDIEGAKKISKTQADELQKGFSLEGDVLLTHKGSVGFVAIVPKLSSDYIMLTPQVTYYRVVNKQKLSNKFLVNYFISPGFQKEFLLLSGGGTRAYLGITEQRNLKVHIPCISEQTKIANFLTAIDEKISQLTQKYDLLKQYKKGVMQQIFSQKLRFKDENGQEFPVWDEKELGDVTEIIMGQSPDSNSYNDLAAGKPLIQGNADISNRKTNPRAWTIAPTKECKVNDIILTVRAPVGAVAISYHNACIGRGVCAIRSKKETISSYVYQLLLWFEPTRWVSLEQGSTFTAVSSKDIKTIDIPFPTLPEQTKIANFLTAIDDKITHTKTQLDAVKLYKKGLLQQLFV